jgi:hypothetical protein
VIDQVLETYFKSEIEEMRKLIPCPHCVSNSKGELSKRQIYEFTYQDCISAVMSRERFLLCRDISSRKMWIDQIAPDIGFKGIPIVDEHSKHHSSVTIESKIGEGGFATVYKGSLLLKKPVKKTEEVAIKSVRRENLLEDSKLFEDFQREARMMWYVSQVVL